jgi:hypothetical protein
VIDDPTVPNDRVMVLKALGPPAQA